MKTATLSLLAASAIALAACSGAKDPEQPAAETNVIDLSEPENMPNVAVEAPPAIPVENTAAAEAPPATLSADEQTLDDADATGMTARVNRDDSGNTAQPVQ